MWYDKWDYQEEPAAMSTTKVAITLDREVLRQVDRLVAEGRYSSRSRAIQEAVRRHLERTRRRRLAEEAAKLDPKEERALAEEDLAGEIWPES
jgi:Arc/MetJ-type ribon-helix-helix transcriptional regulator